MKFRDDIDPANTWVVSDTHFGHENIVGFCHRPEDHDQVIVAEWRKEVPDDATVIHLGDLSYKGNAWFQNIIAKELTGAKKLLIIGNHDRKGLNWYRRCGFIPCRPFQIPLSVRPGGLGWEGPVSNHGYADFIVSFSHYPWNTAEDGPQSVRDIRLHGHIHNNGYTRDAFVPFLKNHINLSVEQTKYKPVNLKLLLDAALLGRYPETTEEQLEDARDRKEANLARA